VVLIYLLFPSIYLLFFSVFCFEFLGFSPVCLDVLDFPSFSHWYFTKGRVLGRKALTMA
jgi:hypothetical protein